MKKLIVCDLDGTLLRNDRTVSDRTKAAIKKWIDSGNYFTIDTGRIMNGARYYYDMLGLDIPFVCVNGAIIHNHDKSVLHERVIEMETSKAIFKWLSSGDEYFHIYSGTRIFSNNLRGPANYFRKFHLDHGEEYRIDYHLLEDEDGIDQILQQVHKFGIKIEEEKYLQLREMLDTYKDIQYFRSTNDMLDIVSIHADKGKSALALADHLGVSRENVIAIGDNENDISMLTDSSYGIAMGDAPEILKAVSSYITTTNEEDGVAMAIEHCLSMLGS